MYDGLVLFSLAAVINIGGICLSGRGRRLLGGGDGAIVGDNVGDGVVT